MIESVFLFWFYTFFFFIIFILPSCLTKIIIKKKYHSTGVYTQIKFTQCNFKIFFFSSSLYFIFCQFIESAFREQKCKLLCEQHNNMYYRGFSYRMSFLLIIHLNFYFIKYFIIRLEKYVYTDMNFVKIFHLNG